MLISYKGELWSDFEDAARSLLAEWRLVDLVQLRLRSDGVPRENVDVEVRRAGLAHHRRLLRVTKQIGKVDG